MERYYFCNLLFFQNQMRDTEKAEWVPQNSISGSNKDIQYTTNSMRITKANCYLYHTSSMQITTNKFTIAFSYRINLKESHEASELASDICALEWNNGNIKILDFEEVPVLKVTINDIVITVPVDYEKDNDWNNIVICYDNQLIRIFHNGRMKKEELYTQVIDYNFTYFKFGNCSSTLESIITSIDYNHFVFVNDSLYNEEFEVKNMLHLLFPEVNLQPPIEKTYETLYKAPYIYSSNKSYQEIINDHEVVRPKKYKPDKSLFELKYRFA